MRIHATLLLLILAGVAPARVRAQSDAAKADLPGSGPVRGTLLLEGGGRLRGTEIVTRFVALAGGPDRNYVVITTAISDTESAPARMAHCGAGSAAIFGVAHVTCLDARDRDEANSAAFVAALRRADAVWFYGGEEDRLADRYVGTKAEEALRAVLDRGGVVGGTSAGAMILASLIPTRASLPRSAFGFLQGTTIAPHYAQRGYESYLRKVLAGHPALRGLGIDESTAAIVHDGRIEVIGDGSVTLMGAKETVLRRGDRLDLRSGD